MSVAVPTRPVPVAERLQRFATRPESPSLLFLAAVLVVFSLTIDGFFDVNNLEGTLSQVAVIGIVALAINQVILAGEIDVSTGSMLGVCALLAGLVAERTDGLLAALGTALAVGAFFGAVNGLLVTRLRLPSIIATLGLLYILRGTLLAEGGDTVANAPSGARVLGTGQVLGIDVAVFLLIAVFAAFEILHRHSLWGREVLAVGGNGEAARIAGLRVNWVRFRGFLLVGVCVGLAAMVYVGQIGQVQATAATGFELQPIAAAVIGGTSIAGGRGSNLAPLIGAVLIGVILNALTLLSVPGTYVDLVMGGLILVAILTDVLRRRLLKEGT
jgi:ribose/xylose/arabinose/galactoside ABC-type transport system permease subunit